MSTNWILSPGIPITRFTYGMLMFSGYLNTTTSPRRTSWYGSRYFVIDPGGEYGILSTIRWSPVMIVDSIDAVGTTNGCATVDVNQTRRTMLNAQSAIQCRSGSVLAAFF